MRGELPDAVADTSGARYDLGAMLGRGGQGVVFAVRGRPLAVKLASAQTPSARRRVQESIARVKRLPLQGLNVARPLRALAPPHVGYVMELMTGMEPMTRLARAPKGRAADLAPWYLETGSLLRRLRALARAADIFAELHGRGLTYGDASLDNVFVSEDHEAHEAWLIDCDNVASGVRRRAVYTPGYAAPELFRRRSSDSLTDAWSFATIAFESLCVLHPFVGDAVHDGEPEMEERAFAGELVWVDDPSGANEASRGLPRGMVLSPDLKALAAECFGASRTDRQQRPGVASWSEKLHRAADQVLVCRECESSYYLNNRACPWCDAPRPAFAVLSIYLRDLALLDTKRNPSHLVCREAGVPRAVHRVVVQGDRDVVLSERHLRGARDHAMVLRASLHDTRLSLRGEDAAGWCLRRLRRRDGQILPLAGRTQHLDLSAGRQSWWLLPESPQKLHRALSFEWVSEVRL